MEALAKEAGCGYTRSRALLSLFLLKITLSSKAQPGLRSGFLLKELVVRACGLVSLELVMLRYGLTFWLVAALAPFSFLARQENIDAVLNRSEELYYEANFQESLELLIALDKSIQSRPDNGAQKVRLKLQLALDYFALGDVKNAKAGFAEMCAPDPNCSIDVVKYPPKV